MNESAAETALCINTKLNFDSTTPSFTVTIQDICEMMEKTARADNGGDKSVVLAKISEKTVLNGIGNISKIDPIKIQVGFKAIYDGKLSRIRWAWTAPRLVLLLNAGLPALTNSTFLVARHR